MPTEECYEECEILMSIYSDTEICIEHDKPKKGESLISMVLYPSTGDDETIRHVTITLEFVLPPKYPEVVPLITFRNPRGLSEVKLEQLQITVVKKSEELIGSSMMFQIRDIVQDFLTGNNRPASECPICLLSFTDFDVFFRTDCYHHYHSKCLGTYLQNVITTFKTAGEQKLPNEKLVLCCPVCRKELDPETDVENLLSAPPPSEESQDDTEDGKNEDVTLSLPAEWLGKREKLKALYQKQKQQGGIIDLTEKNKKLLVISGTSSTASSAEGGTSTATTPPSDTPPIVSSMPPPPPPTRNAKDITNGPRRMAPPNNGTTPMTMTHTQRGSSHNQHGQIRHGYCPSNRDRAVEDGIGHGHGGSRQISSQLRDDSHVHARGHGHHNRPRTHYRGGYHHGYNNGSSNNGPESKGARNTNNSANPSMAPVPTGAELTSESQSQNKVTSHGHGRSHGQGHNRERRRAK